MTIEDHYHTHEGLGHRHPHGAGMPHHHGPAFGKKPKIIHIGEDLSEKLEESIREERRKREQQRATEVADGYETAPDSNQPDAVQGE